MLNNFILSVNIVFPLLIMMLVGYIARRAGKGTDKGLKEMNGLVFQVFMPILLFNNVRKSSVNSMEGISSLLFTSIGLAIGFLLILFLVPKFEKSNPRRGTIVQAMFRSNYALFGLAIVQNIYPNETLTIPSLMLLASVPIYNILSVVCLEMFRGGQVHLGPMLKKIITNPLIVGCIAGFVVFLLGNPLPEVLDSALTSLGKISTPLALFILGATFNFDALRGNGKALTWIAAVKLVLLPLAAVAAAAVIGYRGQAISSILIAFGGPVAVGSFPMAEQMGGDGELAGQAVIVTTVLAVFTTFLFIFGMKMLNLI